jgi:DNA-binding NtrC family response regulator
MRLGSSHYIPGRLQIDAATTKTFWIWLKSHSFARICITVLFFFKINLPPLRERNSDIIPLSQAFIRKAAIRLNVAEPVLSDTAKLRLLQYSWPGNVRQLDNAMLYAVHECKNGVIWPGDLPDDIIASGSAISQKNNETQNKTSDSKVNLPIKDLELCPSRRHYNLQAIISEKHPKY